MPEIRELTYAEALREGLRQAMESDPSGFIIGEDVGVYGGMFGVARGAARRCLHWCSINRYAASG